MLIKLLVTAMGFSLASADPVELLFCQNTKCASFCGQQNEGYARLGVEADSGKFYFYRCFDSLYIYG